MKQILKYLPITLIVFGGLLIMASILHIKEPSIPPPAPKPAIVIKSIDTMKYSRDLSREKLNDLSFDTVIEKQVSDIAQTDANYIALGTPYDKEFVPYLKRWVTSARKNHLKVWFRGNLSGWEGWFNYPPLDRQAHIQNIRDFILQNSDLFEDGDIFTSCSECENGGSGDPRKTGDVQGFRNFLIAEYNSNKETLSKINRKVDTGYFSMNYDVAKLIMDPATTKALGNIVVIDHYVASPLQLATDAVSLAKSSGGKIVFGELGAPIEDINGKMTEDEQADWIGRALNNINNITAIIGINYWVNTGGSTQIWEENGNPRKAVEVIKKFYTPASLSPVPSPSPEFSESPKINQNQAGCETDNDCPSDQSCKTIGPIIANQPIKKVCVPKDQITPL